MLHLKVCTPVPRPHPCPARMNVEGLSVLQQALQLSIEHRLPRVKSLPWPMINETHLFPSLMMDWTCCNASQPADLIFLAYNATTRHVDVSRDVTSETYPDLAEYIMHLGRLSASLSSSAVPTPSLIATANENAAHASISPLALTLAIVTTLVVVAFLGFLLFT